VGLSPFFSFHMHEFMYIEWVSDLFFFHMHEFIYVYIGPMWNQVLNDEWVSVLFFFHMHEFIYVYVGPMWNQVLNDEWVSVSSGREDFGQMKRTQYEVSVFFLFFYIFITYVFLSSHYRCVNNNFFCKYRCVNNNFLLCK
jgi:hypothetical protein